MHIPPSARCAICVGVNLSMLAGAQQMFVYDDEQVLGPRQGDPGLGPTAVPDGAIAVNEDWVIVLTNARVKVFDRTNELMLAGEVATDDWLGANSDPRAIWDPATSQFVLSHVESPLAYSQPNTVLPLKLDNGMNNGWWTTEIAVSESDFPCDCDDCGHPPCPNPDGEPEYLLISDQTALGYDGHAWLLASTATRYLDTPPYNQVGHPNNLAFRRMIVPSAPAAC
jgi:hypothetical protein